MKTVEQHITETANKPNPLHAEMIPATNDTSPIPGHEVASIMAGNVITDKVTYGT